MFIGRTDAKPEAPILWPPDVNEKLSHWKRLLRVPWTARRSNQSILMERPCIFIGRTDAEAEAPILWSPDVKN